MYEIHNISQLMMTDNEEMKEITNLNCVSEAYVLKIVVKEITNNSDYHLLVSGRSRFCNYLPKSKFLTYSSFTQYKELKEMHKDLMSILKLETKSNNDILKMPEFPSDQLLKNETVDKQIALFNEYFDKLRFTYGQYVIYSETLINLCKPIPIDILILPAEKKMRNMYLNNVMKKLYKPDEAIMSYDKHKSTWKNYVPFDYLHKEHLFRIDFVNQHVTDTSLFKLLKYTTNVFVLADGTNKNYMKELKDILSGIGNNSKASQARTDVVIAIILNEEKTDIEKTLGSVLHKATKFACIHCSTAEDNLLEPLNLLLNFCT